MQESTKVEKQKILVQNNKNEQQQNMNKVTGEDEEEDEDDIYFREYINNRDYKVPWLEETNSILERFNNTYNEVKKEQKGIQEGFKLFAQNENKYHLSSMKKIEIHLDRKQLYDDYMLKTRKTIQKVSPTLMLNILAYTDSHLFLALLRMRRVSQVFNLIYHNQSIQKYLAEKDYLFQGSSSSVLKSSLVYCKKYLSFYQTFMHYKQMHYSEQIPQNSIMKDFQEAVNFINEIHKLVIQKSSRSFTYFKLVNNFMKAHRVVMGLSSLSLSSLAMVRKAAIISFSNFLAFNQNQRSKQQITKTKYLKVISVVQNQNYRESLLINTKVSNFLLDNFHTSFAVLVTNNKTMKNSLPHVKSWDILIYHTRDESKAVFLENLSLQQNKFFSSKFDLEFSQNMDKCTFSTFQYLNYIKMEADGKLMDTIISTNQNNFQQKCNISKIGYDEHNQIEIFSFCHFYQLEQYYVIAIPNKFQ